MKQRAIIESAPFWSRAEDEFPETGPPKIV